MVLARALANTIWPRFSTYVTSASRSDEEMGRNRQEIGRSVKAVSAGLPVLKVNIYDLEGLTVYSSNPSEIGEYKNNNPGFFSAARDGNPACACRKPHPARILSSGVKDVVMRTRDRGAKGDIGVQGCRKSNFPVPILREFVANLLI